MTASACCRGRIVCGRCLGCGQWQRTCGGCGKRFAASRRHAVSCGPACRMRKSRQRLVSETVPTKRNIADVSPDRKRNGRTPVRAVRCYACGGEMPGLEGPLPIPAYCIDCSQIDNIARSLADVPRVAKAQGRPATLMTERPPAREQCAP